MTVRTFMRYRCSTLRATSTPDEYNENVKTWATYLTDVPCRWWEATGEQVLADLNRSQLVDRSRLMVEDDRDVTSDDRVGDVVDRHGNVVATGPFVVEGEVARPAMGTKIILLRKL